MKTIFKNFLSVSFILMIFGFIISIFCSAFDTMFGIFPSLFLILSGIVLSILMLIFILLKKVFLFKIISFFTFIGLATFLLFGRGICVSIGDYLILTSKIKKLNSFVLDIKQYKKIFSMSNGLRYYKDLNGHFITYDTCYIDTSSNPPCKRIEKINDVLRTNDISRIKYDEFRNKLIHLGFSFVSRFKMDQSFLQKMAF